MSAYELWQYHELLATARGCMANYQATHTFRYLWLAMDYTCRAATLRRKP